MTSMWHLPHTIATISCSSEASTTTNGGDDGSCKSKPWISDGSVHMRLSSRSILGRGLGISVLHLGSLDALLLVLVNLDIRIQVVNVASSGSGTSRVVKEKEDLNLLPGDGTKKSANEK